MTLKVDEAVKKIKAGKMVEEIDANKKTLKLAIVEIVKQKCKDWDIAYEIDVDITGVGLPDGTYAQIPMLHDYLRATMQINPQSFSDYDDNETMLKAIEHELCHVILYPISVLRHKLSDKLPEDIREEFMEYASTADEQCTEIVRRLIKKLEK